MLTEKQHIKKYKLDAFEVDILRSFENHPKVLAELRKTVEEYEKRKKEESITLRVNSQDLIEFKAKAADSGIRYQTYLSAIIHQVASGKLEVKL